MPENTAAPAPTDASAHGPKVTPCRIVLYSDGEEEYPGVVTHVWDPGLVNVFVFPDGSFPDRDVGPQTSIPFYADGPSEERAGPSWRWPPRG